MPSTTAGAPPLGVHDYERAFAVLDRCAGADTVERLQESLLEALGSVYECRHTAFFRADSFTRTATDDTPVVNGLVHSVIDEYKDRWFRRDVLFLRDSLERVRRTGVTALIQLDPRGIPDPERDYLDGFLFRAGVHSICALDLELPDSRRGVVAVLHDEPDALVPADLAGFGLVVRHLSSVSRRLPAGTPHPAGTSRLDALPPRLRHIAALLGQGRTNAAIARETGLALDTVKKYVSRILDETGCRNRTEVALLAGRR